MAKYKILNWHGIPSQVRAQDENGRHSVRLSDRFQIAIDRAAMGAKLFDDDDYTNGFQWQPEQDRAGSAEEVAMAIAADIESEITNDDLKALVAKIRQEHNHD